jgi:hypothetical protein
VINVARKPSLKLGSTSSKKPAASAIDRDKLRAAFRRLGDEYLFYMLDDAIDLLPPVKVAKLVSKYLDAKQLRPDAPEKNLLAEVRAFDTASRAGKYYESFNVNSKNCTDKSMGTRAFIADCNRLLDRCVAQASKGDAADVREAIEIVLGVLRHVDECHDDVSSSRTKVVRGRWGSTGRRCCRRGSRACLEPRSPTSTLAASSRSWTSSTSTTVQSSCPRRGGSPPLPSAKLCSARSVTSSSVSATGDRHPPFAVTAIRRNAPLDNGTTIPVVARIPASHRSDRL